MVAAGVATMNKSIVNIISWILFAVLCGASCNPTPPPDPPQPVDANATGVYVLCEGIFQMNNSQLSYYDFASNTLTEQLFLQQNGRGLGDTGNDLKAYGSKLYCVVNNSNRVEVMRFRDAHSLQVIELPNKQPRHIVFYQNKAYVSCFDGDVVRIDTATLEVDGSVNAGYNPEGLCVCNGKLYVANSGGLNYPDYDRTVSIFDLSTFSLIKTIEVGLNPYAVASYDDRFVYVTTRGNYGTELANMHKIDCQTDEVVKSYEMEVFGLYVYDDKAYLYSNDLLSQNNWIKVMDLETDRIVKENLITDGTTIRRPYGIMVNPVNGDVYVTDAYNFTVNGDVYCFDKDGRKKFSFGVGLNPSAMVLRYE